LFEAAGAAGLFRLPVAAREEGAYFSAAADRDVCRILVGTPSGPVRRGRAGPTARRSSPAKRPLRS